MNKLKSIIPCIYNEMMDFVRDSDDLMDYIEGLKSITGEGDAYWYSIIFENELLQMEKQIENLKKDRNFVFNLSYEGVNDFFNYQIEFFKELYIKEKNLKSWNKIKKFDYELWVRLIEKYTIGNYNNYFDLLDYIMDGSEYSDKILEELDFIQNKNNHKFILEYIKQNKN